MKKKNPVVVLIALVDVCVCRGKVCDELEDYMLEEDRSTFTLQLEDMENWLYEDGEYAEKKVYQVSSNQFSFLKSQIVLFVCFFR